ncbi:AMP-binding protein, partial [bacterium]|nr:AMP-binding protein [bacterium]
APRPDEVINIQYTSGTTGYPKAAQLTHRNILFNGWYVTGCQNITSTDRMCIPVPYYHCFGCVMGTLGAVTRGAAMVIPAEYFDAGKSLKAIEEERCTTVYGVPTMFIAMLEHKHFKPKTYPSLRSGIMAGSPCPIEVMKRVVSDMGVREITIAYGQTETAPVITQTRAEDSLEQRVETIGRPLPGVEAKIIDPTTLQTLGDNEQGELCARGHGVMKGYYKDDASTEKGFLPDGFWRTGDLATRRPDGNYKITGRIKEMICRGGENIYPREIEEFLFTHPAIEQSAIFGIPDDKFGETSAAWVSLKHGHSLTEQEVKDFCRKGLAHYKCPAHVRFVTEFPQTVSGKLQKFKMREAMMAELGLKEQKTA